MPKSGRGSGDSDNRLDELWQLIGAPSCSAGFHRMKVPGEEHGAKL